MLSQNKKQFKSNDFNAQVHYKEMRHSILSVFHLLTQISLVQDLVSDKSIK
jgi:hypothetical protein